VEQLLLPFSFITALFGFEHKEKPPIVYYDWRFKPLFNFVLARGFISVTPTNAPRLRVSKCAYKIWFLYENRIAVENAPKISIGFSVDFIRVFCLIFTNKNHATILYSWGCSKLSRALSCVLLSSDECICPLVRFCLDKK
jgi:hypothetical protein